MRSAVGTTILFAFLLGGCAFLGHAKERYELSKQTPYGLGEVTVEKQTDTLVNTVSGIPYANLSAPVLALLAPFVLHWLRGGRLKKGENLVGASPVQAGFSLLDGLRHSVFEVGPDGSALKRGWKVALLAYIGTQYGAPLLHQFIPYVQENHPDWLSGIYLSAFIGLLAAAEKSLSKATQQVSA